MTRQRLSAALQRNVSTLPFGAVIGILATALTIIGALAGFARWVHSTVNDIPTDAKIAATYVRRDSFAIYQAGWERRWGIDSTARAARDARIDTALGQLVRACQHKGDCP